MERNKVSASEASVLAMPDQLHPGAYPGWPVMIACEGFGVLRRDCVTRCERTGCNA